MSAYGGFGVPGQGAALMTTEREIIAYGMGVERCLVQSSIISGAARDAGNSPDTILRSGLCIERSLTTVQQAYRALQGSITVQPFKAEATLRHTYHRLNDDYEGLHALCRFFLDHSGPSHHAGEQTMMAFAVDMARLYERFVAAWLRAHLDPRWRGQVTPVYVERTLREAAGS